MKLSFSTLGCPDWSYETVLDSASRLGYSAVSVRGICRQNDITKIPEFLPENRAETLKKAESAGVKLLCICTGCFFHSKERAEAGIKEGIAAVKLSADMGIPFIRVFGDTVPEIGETEVLDMIADGIKAVCKSAEGTDVKVLLEVHGNVNTAERVLYIANRVNSDSFGIIWDIMHSDKAYGDEIEPFYNAVKHLVLHTHIKDCVRESGALCGVGDGDIPIIKIINMLKNDGYDGYFEFEWEKQWHPELAEPETAFKDYVEYMKRNFPE